MNETELRIKKDIASSIAIIKNKEQLIALQKQYEKKFEKVTGISIYQVMKNLE